jgi:hypothetical protein
MLTSFHEMGAATAEELRSSSASVYKLQRVINSAKDVVARVAVRRGC